MKNKERVQRIAEEMAKAHFRFIIGPDQVDIFLPAARIAVKHMENEIRLLLSVIKELGPVKNIDALLIERGLISQPEKFHCNNTGRHYSDPGYKPVCGTQCDDCKEEYPAQEGGTDNDTEICERCKNNPVQIESMQGKLLCGGCYEQTDQEGGQDETA